jgi:hypothetical protein
MRERFAVKAYPRHHASTPTLGTTCLHAGGPEQKHLGWPEDTFFRNLLDLLRQKLSLCKVFLKPHCSLIQVILNLPAFC